MLHKQQLETLRSVIVSLPAGRHSQPGVTSSRASLPAGRHSQPSVTPSRVSFPALGVTNCRAVRTHSQTHCTTETLQCHSLQHTEEQAKQLRAVTTSVEAIPAHRPEVLHEPGDSQEHLALLQGTPQEGCRGQGVPQHLVGAWSKTKEVKLQHGNHQTQKHTQRTQYTHVDMYSNSQ